MGLGHVSLRLEYGHRPAGVGQALGVSAPQQRSTPKALANNQLKGMRLALSQLGFCSSPFLVLILPLEKPLFHHIQCAPAACEFISKAREASMGKRSFVRAYYHKANLQRQTVVQPTGTGSNCIWKQRLLGSGNSCDSNRILYRSQT